MLTSRRQSLAKKRLFHVELEGRNLIEKPANKNLASRMVPEVASNKRFTPSTRNVNRVRKSHVVGLGAGIFAGSITYGR